MSADHPRYPHGHFRRQMRGRLKDVVAILFLLLVGSATALVIISEQKAALPGWVPVLGQDFFHIDAEFESGQSLMPGQGQAVTMSGIRIGAIDSVSVEDGQAIVGLDIEPKYARLIHPDASVLLRPKTGLNDMVAEINPGTEEGEIDEGATISQEQTQPNVNVDEFFAALDTDTRAYLKLLLQGGAEGIGGEEGARRLSPIFRRLYPFTRDIARLNGAVAQRRESLARVVHNFRLLAEELGTHDAELARFVRGSAGALQHFATQEGSIREALRELPSALESADAAFASSDRLSEELRPALTGLIPQAQAFPDALRASRQFARETTPVLRDELRPATALLRAPIRELAPAGKPLGKTVKGFRDTLKPLNHGFNELAFNPPGESNESYLFWLSWLNHNLNSTYLTEDAGGPVRRAVVLLSCQTAMLADGARRTNDFLDMLLTATRVPTEDDIC
jgi:phospholipid/cholesterol/gamma-HCH transport system substrate-binding protein